MNQSALSVLTPDHADWLLSQLAARQLPGELLTIELGLEDVEPRLAEVKRFCDSLTASGVQFCLSRFDGDAQAEEVLQALPLTIVLFLLFPRIAPLWDDLWPQVAGLVYVSADATSATVTYENVPEFLFGGIFFCADKCPWQYDGIFD